jgi:hypothetical protein
MISFKTVSTSIYWFDMQTEKDGETEIGCVSEQDSWEAAREGEM